MALWLNKVKWTIKYLLHMVLHNLKSGWAKYRDGSQWLKSRLGVLETWVLVSRLESRDLFLQVLVSVLVLVLEPSSLGLRLGLETSVLVLVLDPSNLGLILGLGTRDSDAFKELHPLLKSLLSACHLCSCGTDI